MKKEFRQFIDGDQDFISKHQFTNKEYFYIKKAMEFYIKIQDSKFNYYNGIFGETLSLLISNITIYTNKNDHDLRKILKNNIDNQMNILDDMMALENIKEGEINNREISIYANKINLDTINIENLDPDNLKYANNIKNTINNLNHDIDILKLNLVSLTKTNNNYLEIREIKDDVSFVVKEMKDDIVTSKLYDSDSFDKLMKFLNDSPDKYS